MKPVLIAVFFINLSTSIQEESQGRLRPAYIYNAGVTKVKESENITFKCRNPNKTESAFHMYLFKNNEKFKMNRIEDTKSDDTVFLLTNLTVEHSGSYTCLYSVEKLSVIKTNETGLNSVSLEVWARIESTETSVTKGETKVNTSFVQVHEKGFGFWSLIISVSVAVSVVLLVLLGLCYCRNILSFRICQDPDVRNNPNNEHFYHEIATDTHYTVENGVLRFSEGPVEDLADNVNNLYSKVQMFEDEQPADKYMESNIDEVCYDSVKAPYAAIQKRKVNAGGNGHDVLVPCKISSMMSSR
ncbi:hypothetical protein Q7C36_010030 [Tachysurus vachellii]|uniref:Ig-like domain-containing protein n=1 Tax=Tachysurus vachellii TaxID=175792 RepID=A0AA88N365_TACVA|nr:hypothetical protein Q7C36_010030 [Tachysurus vachellii]